MRRPLFLATACALALAACSAATPTADPSGAAAPTPTESVRGGTKLGEGLTGGGAEPTSSAQEPGNGGGGSKDDGGGARAAVEPPRAGVYRYAQDGETKAGVFTFEPDEEGTLTIGEPRGDRQRQVRRLSSQQELEQVLSYRARGVFLVSYVSRFATREVECRLEEPVLLIETPLRVGSSWSDDGLCDGLTMSVKGTVTGREDRTVGSTPVDTFVVKLTIEAEGDGMRQRTVSTLWTSVEHRLVVRSVERSEGAVGGQDFTSRRTDDLLSLEPA